MSWFTRLFRRDRAATETIDISNPSPSPAGETREDRGDNVQFLLPPGQEFVTDDDRTRVIAEVFRTGKPVHMRVRGDDDTVGEGTCA